MRLIGITIPKRLDATTQLRQVEKLKQSLQAQSTLEAGEDALHRIGTKTGQGWPPRRGEHATDKRSKDSSGGEERSKKVRRDESPLRSHDRMFLLWWTKKRGKARCERFRYTEFSQKMPKGGK